MDELVKYLLGIAAAGFMMTTGILGWALKVIRDGDRRDITASRELAARALDETQEIRENYIDRFEKLQQSVHDGQQVIVNQIVKLEKTLILRYVPREEIKEMLRRP